MRRSNVSRYWSSILFLCVLVFLGQPGSRAASQTNVYLDYRDQAFDTMSVDSTDSIETSVSACSPDNVSR